VPCKCGQVYIGQICRSIETRVEHQRHIHLQHPDKSAVAEHSISLDHCIPLTSSDRLASTRGAPKKGRFFQQLSCCPFSSWPCVACPLFPIGSRASPDPDPIPHRAGQGFCLGWLIPIFQTVSTCVAYSTPWWWRQQGPLKHW
jgi:hypothetical protein